MISFKTFFETENFQNQGITLEHLSRVQKARTNEFDMFIQQMANKYPSLKWKTPPLGFRSILHSAAAWSPLRKNEKEILSPQEQIKYTTKGERLVAAKKAFEDAGGEYD